jgi:hypothetical protein
MDEAAEQHEDLEEPLVRAAPWPADLLQGRAGTSIHSPNIISFFHSTSDELP